MATSKATKKFQSKHLKHTLDHRREQKKHSQKLASHKRPKSDNPHVAPSKEVFPDMSVEDFFAGGFEVPKDKKVARSAAAKKAAADEAALEAEDASSSEDENHEDDLQKLEQSDPDFYKYLQNNDKDLLDFKPVNPLDAMDEDDDEEMEDGEEEEEVEPKKKDKKEVFKEEEKIEVTFKLVKQWETQLLKPNLKLIKNLVAAFKSGVNVNDSQDYKYSITNPKIFNKLMFLVLNQLPVAIKLLVSYKVVNEVRQLPQSNKMVQPLSTILKTHSSSLIILLRDTNNIEIFTIILKSLFELFPFYLSHRKLIKKILSTIVEIWSHTKKFDIQVTAFAMINNLCQEFSSLVSTCLKLTYSTFVKSCNKTNIHNIDLINFQKNSAVQLYKVNEHTSYQIGFEYIRQLAILLRNSMTDTSNSKQGYKLIYNWQYVHSLDFWSRILSSIDEKSPMRQLIYPLVQVTLGCIKLIPTPQFFPLRIYLIKSLIRLANSTNVYIPVYPLIHDVLVSNAITKKPRVVATLQPLEFDYLIKVNQAYLGTKTYQDALFNELIEVLSEFLVVYAKDISFPELTTPILLSLRKFTKTCGNMKFNKVLSGLVEKIKLNISQVEKVRAGVEFGPNDKGAIKKFMLDVTLEKLGVGEFVTVQRQIKAERLRVFKESAAENEEERTKKRGDDVEDVAAEESEDEEEEE